MAIGSDSMFVTLFSQIQMTQKISIALNSPFRDLAEFVFFCVIGFGAGTLGLL